LPPQNASAEKLLSESGAVTGSVGSSAWITMAQITIQAESWRRHRVRQMFTQIALDTPSSVYRDDK
jgi:hypothetical protein